MKRFAPAPPPPPLKPGGIAERALAAVMRRGPVPEDKEKTRRSQEYWAEFRRKQAEKAEADQQAKTAPVRRW